MRRRVVLGVASVVTVSFGSILYGFSVYATDLAAGAEFSTTALSIGYGGSAIVGGLVAIPLGRWMDRTGVRTVLVLGGVLGGLGMLAFSMADQPYEVVLAWWLLIGPATAMLYYEPAFVVINHLVEPEARAKALGLLTVVGGLAGAVFIPLAERLNDAFGWRPTVRILGSLIAVVAVVVAVFVVPKMELRTPGRTSSSALVFLRDRRFLLLTGAMVAGFGSVQALIAHRLDHFSEVGIALVVVSGWAGAASLISLPGRYFAPVIAARRNSTAVMAIVMVVMAASLLAAVAATTRGAMVGHFLLFGASFGAVTPLRALVMAGWFGEEGYGAAMGLQQGITQVLAALGPILVGFARDRTGSYTPSFTVLATVTLVGAVLIFASDRRKAIAG